MNPSQQNLIQLTSPALTKALMAELMLHPEKLSAVVRELLQSADPAREEIVTKALQKIVLYADLSALIGMSENFERNQWQRASIRYLIGRQAPYELMHDLFKLSRSEFKQMREADGLTQTKPPKVPTHQIDQIYRVWQAVCKEKDTEVERWLAMAQKFPDIRVSSLYCVCIKEGASPSVFEKIQA
jgi:type I site-specific restriction endonuclease